MTSSTPGVSVPDEFNAVDFHWKVIGRFDTYIGATNTKGALLIGLTTFVFTSIVLKWTELTGTASFRENQWFWSMLTGIALLVAAISALVVTWKVIKIIKPQLSSTKRVGQYHSTIFFEHVAEHDKPEDYAAAVQGLDTPKALQDLSFQAYDLSGILTTKFEELSKATAIIFKWMLPALASLIVIRLIALGLDVVPKLHP